MTHALTEGGESSQVSDSEGSGEPPKKGDICIDECGQPQVFDGNGWVPWRFVVTGTGQITPTDSPIDWVLGAWKTPFQAADDIAILGISGMKVPKGELWVDIASGISYKAGTLVVEGGKYLKFFKDKIKTDFTRTSTSRGVPSPLPTPRTTPKSKWGPILDLIFGNFDLPK